MALQTKTFTYGSYTGEEFDKYVLELTLTEDSIDAVNNTSAISYTLVLKSGAYNRFEGRVDSTLKLNGNIVATNSETKYLDYHKSWTLLSGTATVTHGADGSLDMPIVVEIDTAESNQWSPDDTTVNWNMVLTPIDVGLAYISNESGSFEKYLPYKHNGTEWERYIPEVHDGES